MYHPDDCYGVRLTLEEYDAPTHREATMQELKVKEEDIKDWDVLLEELYRIMKKGSKMVISTHHPLAMYLYLKPKSYYEFKLIEDTWGHPEHRFKVRYYMRPLTKIIQPLLESKFKINNIEEILPEEKLKDTHPELYQQIDHRTAIQTGY